jgi:glycosyltransferase involved in cell wall biosynthesis
MISFIRQEQGGLTYVLAILGEYSRVESALARSIERLEQIVRDSDCRVVVVLEDPRWETVPLVQTLGMRFPEDRLKVICGEWADRPARLFTAAAEQAEGEFLAFLWPGCMPDHAAVVAACEAADQEGLDWLAFAGPLADQLPEICSPDLGDRFYSYYLACGRFLPLCQGVVRRLSVLEVHGFDDSPLLQREFDADFWLRLVCGGHKGLIRRGALTDARWTWEDFPLQNDFRVPRYLSHSYRVRESGRGLDTDRREAARKFVRDLPPALRRTVDRLKCFDSNAMVDVESGPVQSGSAPCPAFRIAVTGGPWEFAHNQLCFFNHFRELEGRGLFTSVPLLDHLIVPERDLQGMDAVIISRGRHANVRRVIDYCRSRSIATLYMIDDNWLTVGRDWPEPYASIFAPGLPQYEMFLACLRECDAVLTYNDFLADDVRPYARQVLRIPTNVRQADFTAPLRHFELRSRIEQLDEWRRQSGGLLAGYIGSLRYNDGAFLALASPEIRRWRPVKVVLFGVVSAEQRQLFHNQAAVLPYVGYDDYAAAVGAMKPDILVAPLDDSRTSRSKCPNKYLEYSIAGAAGVYSDVSPYSQTIVDGDTGLLVADDEASWTAAIARLAEDDALRRSIAAAARRDVLRRFETSVVAPRFAEALVSLIRQCGSRPGRGADCQSAQAGRSATCPATRSPETNRCQEPTTC